ncbi:MAG TPA: hypothetical protein VK668_12100 [Mucilaginibacter sp.]|nr:hypothetical protein [Mucilaginibacter sp.]
MYKLARHFFILSFLLIAGYTALGQVRPFRQPPNYQQRVIRKQNGISKIDAVQETYIAKRLNLSADQSVKFWPLYRRYRDAIKEVRRKKRINNSSAQADGTDQIQKELFYEGELVNIRKYYTDEFLKMLPPDKVSQIFKSEREFTDELIKQLRERSTPVKNP